MIKKLFFVTLFVILSINSFSTHFAGGNIYYDCIGGNRYVISAEITLDCSGISRPSTVSVIANNSCGFTNFTIRLPLIDSFSKNVSQVCTRDSIFTTCFGGSIPGRKSYFYIDTVTLLPCNTWNFSWRSCCRNNSVVNTTGGGVFLETTMNSATDSCNNSVRYTGIQNPYVCVGSPASYNFGAFDPDGDSIIYRLIPTSVNPGVSANYVAPYTGLVPISGMVLDSTTGTITFLPNVLGSFIVAVRVYEYDTLGVLLGTTIRDIQIVVYNCMANSAPNTAPTSFYNLRGGGAITGNKRIEVCPGDTFCVDFQIADSNASDTLTLSSSNMTSVLPGATLTYTGTNPITGTLCWVAPFGGPNSNTISLEVSDEFCPIPAVSSFSITIGISNCVTTSSSINVISCDSLVSPGLKVWKTSGVYYDTITRIGICCDSIITFNVTIIKPTYSSSTLVTCDSITSPTGKIWKASGIYKDTLMNSIGCDSVITFYITVNSPTYSSSNLVTCDSIISPTGKIWKTSGTYLDTITNSKGCDSIITFYINANSITYSSSNLVTCDSIISPTGKIWKMSGTYFDTILSSKGCDSIITFYITINSPTYSSSTLVTCDSITSPTGKIWKTSGTYLDTLTNVSNCDSIVTFYITVNSPTYSSSTLVTCDSITSPTGKIWKTSGTYTDTLINSVACDSIITFYVTVNSPNYSFSNFVTCDSITSPTGKVWKTSGTYLDTLANTKSCDSIITFYITVNSPTYYSSTLVTCDSITSPTGKIWKTSGTYLDTILNAKSCDSIITFYITVNSPTYSSSTLVTCDSIISPTGKIWKTSGTYLDTILNAKSCDSIITFYVTVNSPTYSSSTLVTCDSITSPTGKIWKISGTYTDTLINSVGCDSIITFYITVNSPTYSTFNFVTCDSIISPTGKVWKVSGTYMDTLTNAKSCDSIVTFNFIVNSPTYSSLTLVSCDSMISPTGKVWKISGTYLDTLSNVKKCDSIITFYITINITTYSSSTLVVCDSIISPTGKIWNTSGTYLDTILNASSCDSIITFYITVNNTSYTNLNIRACDVTTYNGITYSSSTVVIDTLSSLVTSCDSLIITTISIIPTPTLSLTPLIDTIILGDNKLLTASGAGSYFWDNGQTSNSIIVWPTNRLETYCVIGTNSNLCSDTLCSVIFVKKDHYIFLPNSFTPDANGLNDSYKPITYNVSRENYKFEIYNRWGELFFSTTNFDDFWDGKNKSEEIKTDVYVWVVTYKSEIDKRTYRKMGHVKLIK